jgi:hypothetical protein
MRFDDLLGDRQAETRVLAKALMRPVGVEALEDALQRMRRQVTRTLPPGVEKDCALDSKLEITWPSRESCPGTENVSAAPRPSKRASTATS